jgi:hypothetical protein
VSVHLHKRELLAELVALTVVYVDVDGSLVQECFVQSVELLLNGFLLALDLDNPLVGVCFQIPPRVKHAILHEAHEARGWLQSGELIDEQLFEFRLADVHRAAARAAVVVRVVVAPSLRPARRQRLAARFAAHLPPERKIEIVSLTWRRDFEPAVQDCLDTVEDLLTDKRFEVAACRDAEIRHVDLRDIRAIAQHSIERLQRDRPTASTTA